MARLPRAPDQTPRSPLCLWALQDPGDLLFGLSAGGTCVLPWVGFHRAIWRCPQTRSPAQHLGLLHPWKLRETGKGSSCLRAAANNNSRHAPRSQRLRSRNQALSPALLGPVQFTRRCPHCLSRSSGNCVALGFASFLTNPVANPWSLPGRLQPRLGVRGSPARAESRMGCGLSSSVEQTE